LNDDAVLQLADNTMKEQEATDNASIAHEDNILLNITFTLALI
jgi:hypothetical protein